MRSVSIRPVAAVVSLREDVANSLQHLRLRFLAPQIVTIIYGKYYAGKRMRGSVDKGFKDKINGNFLCLISAAICHTLRAWQTGTYLEPRDFKRETSLGMSLVPGRTRFVTDTGKELLQRQLRTWGNIPGNLQEGILNHVRNALKDQITRDQGPEEEITIGYEDDHEALQAELNKREAIRNEIRRTANEAGLGKPGNSSNVSTGMVRVFSRSPAISVREESGLGEEDLVESQEHWYVPQEEIASLVVGDAQVLDGACAVGGNLAEGSSESEE